MSFLPHQTQYWVSNHLSDWKYSYWLTRIWSNDPRLNVIVGLFSFFFFSQQNLQFMVGRLGNPLQSWQYVSLKPKIQLTSLFKDVIAYVFGFPYYHRLNPRSHRHKPYLILMLLRYFCHECTLPEHRETCFSLFTVSGSTE